MRLYATFDEVMSEIERDLKELAVVYQSTTVQDKDTSENEGYKTHELMNYSYTLSPAIIPDIQDWPEREYINLEWAERIDGHPHNPGTAWEADAEYWAGYIKGGRFHYTYAERMYNQVPYLKMIMKDDPNTRRGWMAIWDPVKDLLHSHHGSLYERVPCSLGYQVMVREEKVHLHYVMRSCDFIKHFRKDVVLALYFQDYMSNVMNLEMGTFTHTIFSLHAFAKDLEGVF